MKAFVEAFGGLIGVGLIGIAFIAAMIIADWLVVKYQRRRQSGKEDEPLH